MMNINLDVITPRIDMIKRMFPELNSRTPELYFQKNQNCYSLVDEIVLVLVIKNPDSAIYGRVSITQSDMVELDVNVFYSKIIKVAYDSLYQNICEYLKLPYMDRKIRGIP